MAQADAEDGLLAQQAADRVDGVIQRLGIAGPVGEEHAVGLQWPGPPRPWPCRAGSSRGSPCRTGAGRCSTSCRSPAPRRGARRRIVRRRARSAPAVAQRLSGSLPAPRPPSGTTSRTRSRPTRPGLALALATRLASSRSTVERTPFMAPCDADAPDQGPRVDPLHADDAVLREIIVQSRLAQRKLLAERLCSRTMKPGQMRLAALHVLVVDAVVADLGVGHRDDLAAVAGIGEDFLIAGHGGVETDLAVDFAAAPKALPVNTVPSSRASFARSPMRLWPPRIDRHQGSLVGLAAET